MYSVALSDENGLRYRIALSDENGRHGRYVEEQELRMQGQLHEGKRYRKTTREQVDAHARGTAKSHSPMRMDDTEKPKATLNDYQNERQELTGTDGRA